jgi:hypothetical protein
MEVASLTLNTVALATLFNSCVECFEYFSSGKNLEKEFSYLLIRLDFEKTQLLMWGNSSGILKVDIEERYTKFADLTVCKLVEAALNAIQALLSDANALQQRYGVQSTARPVKKLLINPNDLSANNMNLFRTAWSRFCVRVVPERSGASTIARTRWAIHDKAKFADLLETLSTFVEKLHKVIPVPDTQYEVLERDLASILDISKLKLVETALQSSSNPRCQALSRAASEIVADSELGTTDRRRLMDWLGDTQWIQEADEEESGQTLPTQSHQGERLNFDTKLNCLGYNTKESIYFVNTPQCLNRNAAIQCPSIATANLLSDSNVCQFHMDSFATLASFFPNLRKVEHFQPSIYTELLEQLSSLSYEDDELKTLIQEKLNGTIPFRTIYIHTSPCSCALQMSVAIAKELRGKYLTALVRVDDRISCSCYPSATERATALESIVDHLEKLEPKPTYQSNSWWHLVRLWLCQRLYMLETDTGSADNTTSISSALNIFSNDNFPNPLAGLIVVGEVDFCTPLLQAEPFPWTPRFPREREIYEITCQHRSYTRKYIGKFAARSPLKAANGTSSQIQAEQAASLVSQSSWPRGSKRSSSPTASAGVKRMATAVMSELLGANKHRDLSNEGEDEDEDEDGSFSLDGKLLALASDN